MVVEFIVMVMDELLGGLVSVEGDGEGREAREDRGFFFLLVFFYGSACRG